MMHSIIRHKKIVARMMAPMEVMKLSPINANGKRVLRFIQDKGKKPKALIIQEAVSYMAMSASSYATQKEGRIFY
jgi:hypothetical protein